MPNPQRRSDRVTASNLKKDNVSGAHVAGEHSESEDSKCSPSERAAATLERNPGVAEQTSTGGRLLKAEDLAERWSVPKSQVYRLTRAGTLPVVRLGKHFRYRLSSIEAWEAEQEGRADV